MKKFIGLNDNFSLMLDIEYSQQCLVTLLDKKDKKQHFVLLLDIKQSLEKELFTNLFKFSNDLYGFVKFVIDKEIFKQKDIYDILGLENED